MLRAAGADMVGMSTVLEAIAARHLGAEVLAISLVTNPAAGLSDQGLDHTEVIAAGREAAARLGVLLGQILPQVQAEGQG
jgi:purine-nucleoside phosphorylase